jgi:prefoldin subunit 5
MADQIINPPHTIDSLLKVVAMFLGSAAFLKVLGAVINKLLDRRIKQDEYIARDGGEFITFLQKRLEDLEDRITELSEKLEDKRAVELGLKMQVHELQVKVADYEDENKLLRSQLEQVKRENLSLKSEAEARGLLNG